MDKVVLIHRMKRGYEMNDTDKKVNKKSNLKIYIIFAIMILVSLLGGFLAGRLAYQKKIKLEFLPGDEHKIISDVMLLGRAFSNVTSNCIRYAKETVQISVEESGDQLKLTIRDDGPGIAENDLPHLFDRFYKGKNGNHGLGLSIAKRSMEYMGGDIAAESSPDGAVFTIILPQDCRSFAVEEWTEV